MRELLGLIDIAGCMVVADAMHCQTETAHVIIEAKGDYLFNVKGNQETLERDIEDFVKDKELILIPIKNLEKTSTARQQLG